MVAAAAARRSCSRLLLNPRTRLASARSSPLARSLGAIPSSRRSVGRPRARRPPAPDRLLPCGLLLLPLPPPPSFSVAPVTQLFVVAIECASNCPRSLSLSIPEVTGRLTSQSVSRSLTRSRHRASDRGTHTDTRTYGLPHMYSMRRAAYSVLLPLLPATDFSSS